RRAVHLHPARVPGPGGDRLAVRPSELRGRSGLRPHLGACADRAQVEPAAPDREGRRGKQPDRGARPGLSAGFPHAAEAAQAGPAGHQAPLRAVVTAMLEGLEYDDSDSPGIGLVQPGVPRADVADHIKIVHGPLLIPPGEGEAEYSGAYW